jgi:hypothetical protein
MRSTSGHFDDVAWGRITEWAQHVAGRGSEPRRLMLEHEASSPPVDEPEGADLAAAVSAERLESVPWRAFSSSRSITGPDRKTGLTGERLFV